MFGWHITHFCRHVSVLTITLRYDDHVLIIFVVFGPPQKKLISGTTSISALEREALVPNVKAVESLQSETK